MCERKGRLCREMMPEFIPRDHREVENLSAEHGFCVRTISGDKLEIGERIVKWMGERMVSSV